MLLVAPHLAIRPVHRLNRVGPGRAPPMNFDTHAATSWRGVTISTGSSSFTPNESDQRENLDEHKCRKVSDKAESLRRAGTDEKTR